MVVNAFNVCVAVVVVATIVGITAGMRRASDAATHRPALAAMAVHAVLLCSFLVVILALRRSWVLAAVAALVVVVPPAVYHVLCARLKGKGDDAEDGDGAAPGVAWPQLSDSPQVEHPRSSAPRLAPVPAEEGEGGGEGGAHVPAPVDAPVPQQALQVREQRQIRGESARRFALRRTGGESFPAFGSIQAQQAVQALAKPEPVSADGEPLRPVPVAVDAELPNLAFASADEPSADDEALQPEPVEEKTTTSDPAAAHGQAEPLKLAFVEAGGEPMAPASLEEEDEAAQAEAAGAEDGPLRPVPVQEDAPAPRSVPVEAGEESPQPPSPETEGEPSRRTPGEAAAPKAVRDPNIPHADDTAADCKVRAFQRARRREREREEAAEARARTTWETQAHAAEEAAGLRPVPVPAGQPQEAPALPSFEPDEIFYGEDVDAMLDDDFVLDAPADDALPPLEQTVTVAFEAADALQQYEFAAAPAPAPDAAAASAEGFRPDAVPDAPDAASAPAAGSGAAFTVELLEPEAPAAPADDEVLAASAEEEALAWEKFESNRRKAQGFRDRGKNLVAAGLFARAADLAPERQQWREMLFEELGCYVRADKMDEARELARILLAQGTLTRATRIKLNAIISKK